MTSGEVAVQIGRALWHTRVAEVVNHTANTVLTTLGLPPLKYDLAAQANHPNDRKCWDPDPAIEPHDWFGAPEFDNQFLEICVSCGVQRTNMQRLFAYERHLSLRRTTDGR